jgi:hypothetical protein
VFEEAKFTLVSELNREKETIVILKEAANTCKEQSAEKERSLRLKLDNLLASERASFEKNKKALKDEHSKVEKGLYKPRTMTFLLEPMAFCKSPHSRRVVGSEIRTFVPRDVERK